MSICACALVRSLPSLVYVTVAYAVRPSLLICAAPAGPYGLPTEPTSFCPAIFASTGSIRCRTDASRTEPESTCQTTVSPSPDCAGTALSSRSSTFADSVPLSENALEYASPSALPAPPTVSSAANHSRITHHLCRKHHRATAATANNPIRSVVAKSRHEPS